MPKPITQEQLVAMAAGVILEAAVAETVNAEAATETPAQPAPTEEQAAEAPAANSSELVNYLQAQVTTLQAEAIEFRMAAKAATDSLTASKSNLDALADIARSSIRSMTIALGGKAESVDAMSAGDVVTEHARIVPLFKDKFKVGAVAATNTLEDKPVVKATVNPLFAYAAKSLSN